MKRDACLRVLSAVLVGGAVPAYAGEGGGDSFDSVFLAVFLAYCALIAVSHLAEFLRLRLFRKGEPAGSKRDRAFEEA